MSKKRKRVSKKSKTRRTRRSTVKKGRKRTRKRMRGGTTKADRVLRELREPGKKLSAQMKKDEEEDLLAELESLTVPQLKAWAREAGIPKGEREGKGAKALVKMIVTAEEEKANKAREREAAEAEAMLNAMRESRSRRKTDADLDALFDK